MPLSLVEAKSIVPLRPPSSSERQDRHRHPGLLDPRISDLLSLSAQLVRENEWLRRKARENGVKVPAKSAIKLETIEQPWQSDGFQYAALPDLVEPVTVKTKPPKPGKAFREDRRFGPS